MITKVDSTNANAYKRLFLKADAVLDPNSGSEYVQAQYFVEGEVYYIKNNGVYSEADPQPTATTFSSGTYYKQYEALSSLDEYFQWIKELANNDLKYVVLPLDEPAFEIDANTRTISVPAAFRTNGISVQGDEGAEIVYFKIDRYFDSTDLGATDTKILIQWENAKATPESNTSWALIRDIDSEPGKLIFGWYLDERITAAPGTIKFAVRIYKENADGEQVYNFNTLTATAVIQPSLDLNLGSLYMDDTPEQWIKDRLIDSPPTSSTVPAGTPVYTINLVPFDEDQIDDDDDEATVGLVELDATSGSALLKIETVSPDAGIISYEWHRWDVAEDAEEADLTGTPNVLSGERVYERVSEDEFNDESTYYLAVKNNGVTIYEPLSSPYTVDNTTYTDIAAYCTALTNAGSVAYSKSDIYRCYGTCSATQTGYYQAVAQNRVGKNKASKDSYVCEVPGPTTNHIFSIAPASEGEDDVNELNGGKAHVFLDENGAATAKVSVNHDPLNATIYSWTIDGHMCQRAENWLLGDVVYYTKSGDATYTVANPQPTSANFADGEYYVIYDDSADIPVSVAEADRALFDKEYEVFVYDKRNKDVTPTKSVKYRITDKAHAIDVTNEYNESIIVNRVKKSYVQGNTLEVTFDYSKCVHDVLKYEWMQYKGEVDEDNNPLPFDPSNDIPVANASGEITVFDGTQKVTFTPTVAAGQYGDYYCKLTNCIKDGDTVVDSIVFYTPVFTVNML